MNYEENNGQPLPNPAIEGQSTSISQEDKQEEDRKNQSKKRIFWTIVGIDIALVIFLLYEVISLFF